MLETLPPWLNAQWAALFDRQQKGTLPHALLIEGAAGVGKSAFARFVAQALLCVQPSLAGACGRCASCDLLQCGSHPDIAELSPLEGSQVIKIDQVRDMVNWLQLTRQYHSYKIAILSPADALNHNAANSLLKTLEEPARDALLLLLSERRGDIPATVLSRCQRIKLVLQERQIAVQWLYSQGVEEPETALALCSDGPLLALSAMQGELSDIRQRLFAAWQDAVLGKASIARSVETITDLPTRHCLALLSAWVADIVRLKVNGDAKINNPDLRCALSTLGDCLSSEQWFTFYDQLLHLYRSDSASIKTQTVLEGFFADIRLKQKHNQPG